MQTALREIATLNTLIDNLNDSSSDEERVKIIKNTSMNLTELSGYHHVGKTSYGRNLVFSNDDFEVILMCWEAGHKSVPHDHNNSLCVMKCLSGELQEQRYVKKKKITQAITHMNNSQEIIVPTSLSTLELNQATSIKDSEGLHSLMNNSQDSACTLHFYFPPIHQSNIYDIEGSEPKAVTSKFTSEYGVKM